jgi:hypothetical protein
MSHAMLSLPAVVGEDLRSLDATHFHFPVVLALMKLVAAAGAIL